MWQLSNSCYWVLTMVYSLTSAAGDLLRLPGLSVPSAATPGMAARDQGTRQSEPEAAVSSRLAIPCTSPGSGWDKTEAGPLCSAPKAGEVGHSPLYPFPARGTLSSWGAPSWPPAVLAWG